MRDPPPARLIRVVFPPPTRNINSDPGTRNPKFDRPELTCNRCHLTSRAPYCEKETWHTEVRHGEDATDPPA